MASFSNLIVPKPLCVNSLNISSGSSKRSLKSCRRLSITRTSRLYSLYHITSPGTKEKREQNRVLQGSGLLENIVITRSAVDLDLVGFKLNL